MKRKNDIKGAKNTFTIPMYSLAKASKLCKEKGIKMSPRVIRHYAAHGLIRRPDRENKKSCYNGLYIIKELTAIHALKTCFHCSFSTLKELSRVDLSEVLEGLEQTLAEFYASVKKSMNTKSGITLVSEMQKGNIQNKLAEQYFSRIKKGKKVNQADIKKLIQDAFEEYEIE